MNIYLIRHGRQNSKLCNVDVELSPEGREQADLVGKRLQTYHIDVVYSSQLIRAKETADIINKYLNKPRVIEERIQEANFGTMTGMTNEAIDEKYGDYLAQRSTMTTDMTYPDGENCQMVYERAKAGLDDIVKDSLEKGYENICIVTHGGVLRALVTGIMGAPYKNWLAVGRLKTAVFHSFYMMKKAKHIMLKDLMILPILKMRTDYFVNILEVDFLRKNRI